jgi:hypothetical protein
MVKIILLLINLDYVRYFCNVVLEIMDHYLKI